jgi:GLPGLI family protein
MKTINLITLILFFSVANAQQMEKSLKISYTGQFNSLFGRGEDFRPYKAVLHIQGDQSLFTMKPLHLNKEQNNTMAVDLLIDSLFTVYKDLESNSLLFEFMDLDQRSRYYADTLYPMNWDITSDRKNINGIECIKAITQYKGREYVAWYDPLSQIPNGPWKLGGLPGLIIEAYDKEQQWHVVVDLISNEEGFDFNFYRSLMNKPIKGYTSYVADVKKIFSAIEGMMSAQAIGDCLTCETKSTLKFNTWEPIY